MRSALILIAMAGSASAAPRAVIVGRVDGGTWTDAATEARIDQKAELSVVVIDRRGGKRVVMAPAGVEKLKLGGRTVREVVALPATTVKWSTVEPHGFRKSTAKNGATSDFYSNVSTESKSFGRWLGYDTVEYFEHVMFEKGSPIITATIAPSEKDSVQVAGLGTLRFKAEVEVGGAVLATPGAEATDTFGILRSVHRVSIRGGDDFIGWLGAYLLVPEVFGSAGPGKNHQTERFVGADCADVMIGAMRRMGRKMNYTNVAGLPALTTQVAAAVDVDERGMPPTAINGVKPGDLIRIDYGGSLRGHTPRNWDHVAALWEDRSDPKGPAKGGPDGKLDGFDLVIHVGHPRLKIEPLSGQSPATIDVLRWKK